MQVDYLIIGQGLCGSWLSYYLQKAGASVLVLDRGLATSASSAASGVINPITGKRLARQWLGDQILPFAKDAYEEMSLLLNKNVAAEVAIKTFFSTAEEASFFEEKALTSHADLLSTGVSDSHFNYNYGIGEIHPALLVDVRSFLNGWRAALQVSDSLIEEAWDWENCSIENDGVRYNDIPAKAVIDCSGAASAFSPYYSKLPFALNKGEALLARIPGLPTNAVYKHSTLSIVPFSGEDEFWIGSTFDWDFKDLLPTQSFRLKAISILNSWLKLPYELTEHFAAIRPATVTRDAFAGLHPHYPQVGILNGTGAKGCSLAPFLAHNLAQHLVHGTPLIPQVDVSRYKRVLA